MSVPARRTALHRPARATSEARLADPAYTAQYGFQYVQRDACADACSNRHACLLTWIWVVVCLQFKGAGLLPQHGSKQLLRLQLPKCVEGQQGLAPVVHGVMDMQCTLQQGTQPSDAWG
jgi:hypothetical protein